MSQLTIGDPRLFRVVGMIRRRDPNMTAAECICYLRDSQALRADGEPETTTLPPLETDEDLEVLASHIVEYSWPIRQLERLSLAPEANR